MKWPFVRRFKLDAVLTVNQVYLDEINRLNQELASELNSHRETRETKNKVIESNLNQIRGLEGFFERELNLHKDTKQELEETKDALNIAQEDLKNAALCIDEQNTQLKIWKKRSNFYSCNCTEAKEEILKARGYLKTIAKKL